MVGTAVAVAVVVAIVVALAVVAAAVFALAFAFAKRVAVVEVEWLIAVGIVAPNSATTSHSLL